MFIMRMRYDEGLDNDEIASYESKHDIIHHPGFVSEDDETYCGCDTITAPDGKEYPIRDRDQHGACINYKCYCINVQLILLERNQTPLNYGIIPFIYCHGVHVWRVHRDGLVGDYP